MLSSKLCVVSGFALMYVACLGGVVSITNKLRIIVTNSFLSSCYTRGP